MKKQTDQIKHAQDPNDNKKKRNQNFSNPDPISQRHDIYFIGDFRINGSFFLRLLPNSWAGLSK